MKPGSDEVSRTLSSGRTKSCDVGGNLRIDGVEGMINILESGHQQSFSDNANFFKFLSQKEPKLENERKLPSKLHC